MTTRTYQRKVDVDMLNAVKSMLANVSSASPSSELGKTAVEFSSSIWLFSPLGKLMHSALLNEVSLESQLYCSPVHARNRDLVPRALRVRSSRRGPGDEAAQSMKIDHRCQLVHWSIPSIGLKF